MSKGYKVKSSVAVHITIEYHKYHTKRKTGRYNEGIRVGKYRRCVSFQKEF